MLVSVAVKTPTKTIPVITRNTVRILPEAVWGLWMSAYPPVTSVVKLHQRLAQNPEPDSMRSKPMKMQAPNTSDNNPYNRDRLRSRTSNVELK